MFLAIRLRLEQVDLLAVHWVNQEENNGLTFVTYFEAPSILFVCLYNIKQ
jgi:hypothetical protein